MPASLGDPVRFVEHLIQQQGRAVAVVLRQLPPHRHEEAVDVCCGGRLRGGVVLQDQVQPQLFGPVDDLVQEEEQQRGDGGSGGGSGHCRQVDGQTDHVKTEGPDVEQILPCEAAELHLTNTGRLQPPGQVDAAGERQAGGLRFLREQQQNRQPHRCERGAPRRRFRTVLTHGPAGHRTTWRRSATTSPTSVVDPSGQVTPRWATSSSPSPKRSTGSLDPR